MRWIEIDEINRIYEIDEIEKFHVIKKYLAMVEIDRLTPAKLELNEWLLRSIFVLSASAPLRKEWKPEDLIKQDGLSWSFAEEKTKQQWGK